MRIVTLSDTHSYHRQIKIPDGDALVHAGDITWQGELDILKDFIAWMKELPHKHKVFILGNHELGLRNGPKREVFLRMLENSGLHYLENSFVDIEGYRFYGSPASPWFHDWEWNYQRGRDIKAIWDKIDPDTNVLITHGPPAHIGRMDLLDDNVTHVGCIDLYERFCELEKLKLLVCGHIHNGNGNYVWRCLTGDCGFGLDGVVQNINERNVVCINAAICTEQYKPTQPVHVVEI